MKPNIILSKKLKKKVKLLSINKINCNYVKVNLQTPLKNLGNKKKKQKLFVFNNKFFIKSKKEKISSSLNATTYPTSCNRKASKLINIKSNLIKKKFKPKSLNKYNAEVFSRLLVYNQYLNLNKRKKKKVAIKLNNKKIYYSFFSRNFKKFGVISKSENKLFNVLTKTITKKSTQRWPKKISKKSGKNKWKQKFSKEFFMRIKTLYGGLNKYKKSNIFLSIPEVHRIRYSFLGEKLYKNFFKSVQANKNSKRIKYILSNL